MRVHAWLEHIVDGFVPLDLLAVFLDELAQPDQRSKNHKMTTEHTTKG
jgi:hypothetical protein